MTIGPAFSQTNTAFVYQGRLNDGGTNANGEYDLLFIVYDAPFAGSQVGSIITNSTTVSGGLFTATLDFGPGVFTGRNLWLQVGVRTNGSESEFTTLSPRQPVLPTPYAIMANTANTADRATNLVGTLPAAQLSGTVGNSQLAHSALTVTAGTGLSGGGIVSLGGSTTLANAGILSVTGNSDITASSSSGAVTLGSTATSANTPNTIVKRDAGGNFTGGSLTLAGTVVASEVKLANGSQSAVSSPESLRIVRGGVQPTGVIYDGTGFTVIRNSPGVYTVYFDTAFKDIPTVLASGFGGPTSMPTILNSLTNYAIIGTWSGTTPTDHPFTFLAVGAR